MRLGGQGFDGYGAALDHIERDAVVSEHAHSDEGFIAGTVGENCLLLAVPVHRDAVEVVHLYASVGQRHAPAASAGQPELSDDVRWQDQVPGKPGVYYSKDGVLLA